MKMSAKEGFVILKWISNHKFELFANL